MSDSMRILIVDDVHTEHIAYAFEKASVIQREVFGSDDQSTLDLQILSGSFEIATAETLEDAKKALDKWPDVVVLDAVFPESSAPGRKKPAFRADEFLEILDVYPRGPSQLRPEVIIVSAQDETAKKFNQIANWLATGRIRDVLPKSAADLGWHVFQMILRVRTEHYRKEREFRRTQESAQEAFLALENYNIITRDPKMLLVYTEIEEARDNRDWNVFVCGETGTGKELVARAIGGKATHPVNAANLDQDFEADMFGVSGRSFTEVDRRPGHIETAADGVLFVDEIASIRPANQAKFLRAVDTDREYLQKGGAKPRKAECQFVTADSMPLRTAVDKGDFREDLYYRLSHIEIKLPPLRERFGDIRLLVEHFVKQELKTDTPALNFADSVYDAFEEGEWPGNIRRLQQLVARIVRKKKAGRVTMQDVVDAAGSQEKLNEYLYGSKRSGTVTPTRTEVNSPDAAVTDENVAEYITELQQSLDREHEAPRWKRIDLLGVVKCLGAAMDQFVISGKDALKPLCLAIFAESRRGPAEKHLLKILTALIVCSGKEVKQSAFLRFLSGVSSTSLSNIRREFKKIFKTLESRQVGMIKLQKNIREEFERIFLTFETESSSDSQTTYQEDGQEFEGTISMTNTHSRVVLQGLKGKQGINMYQLSLS